MEDDDRDGDEPRGPTYDDLRRLAPPELPLELSAEGGAARELIAEMVLTWVIDAYQHHRASEDTLTRAVAAARRVGITWEMIGGATGGIGKSNASKRYLPRIRANDDPTLS